MRRVLIACLVLTACGSTSTRLAAPTPTPTVPAGPLCGATGRVVSVPGRPVRFCAPVPTAAVGSTAPPPPAYCDLGVGVVGVDLDALTDRREDHGAIEGRAQLTGTFSDATLHVTDQKQAAVGDHPQGYDAPPCPAPAGGWPSGAETENLNTDALQAYQAAHADEVPMVALLRPSAHQVLAYLMTAGDVAAAQTALRPTYGARLCVARSLYTVAQVHAAQEDPGLRGGPGTQIYAFGGTGLGGDGQVTVDVSATYETPAIAAAVARHPKGLVRLDLFLNPVGSAP